MIIDELLIKLKLDLGRFRSDAQQAESTLNNVGDASRRTARNMESDGNFMASGFGKVRNQLLSILGLFTAGMGIKNFTQSTIKQADAFGFMSDSIGMSTTRLRAYSDAAERAGGSGEAMTEALKKSAQDVANLKMGIKTLAEVDQGNLLTRWAGAAGLDPSKIFESGESLLQARLKVFETIRKTDKDNPLLHGVDPAVLANAVLEQGGIGAGVTNVLKNKGGLEGFNAQVSRQEKVNAVLAGSEELARKARESWFDLTQQFEIIGQKIVISLTPAFIKLTEYLKKVKLPSPEVIGKTIDIWVKKFELLWDKTQKTIDYVSEKWNTFSDVVKRVTNNGVDLTDGFTVVATVIGGLVAINVVGWITGIVGALGSLVLAAGSAATALAPLAAVAAAGVAAAGVAAAGAGGAYVGNKLYENASINTQQAIQDTVGAGIAKVAGWMGNKEAQEAIDTNENYKATSGGLDKGLGYISTRYEGQIGTAHKDNKGWAYGRFQFNTGGGLPQFLKDNPQYAQELLASGSPGSEGFNQKWREIAKRDPEGFESAQMKTGRSKYFDPAMAKAKSLGFDTSNRGIQEAMFSGAVQHGGWNTKILPRVAEKYNLSQMSAAEQLKALYAERAAYAKQNLSNDPATLKGVLERYRQEQSNTIELARFSDKKLNRPEMSIAAPEQQAKTPPPVIIPKGEKDIYGQLKKPEMPDVTGLYSSIPNPQTSPRVNNNNQSITIGSQVFNIKANDTEGVKKEVSSKMIIGESLTQNFNSGMRN